MADEKKNLILIIDDDPLVLRTFDLLLKRVGYETVTASNHEDALQTILTKHVDLVLSDIRMPGKNGVETVQTILNHIKSAGRDDLPVIFITGYAEMSDELKADFLGEVLHKPVDMDHLLVTIREYL